MSLACGSGMTNHENIATTFNKLIAKFKRESKPNILHHFSVFSAPNSHDLEFRKIGIECLAGNFLTSSKVN